MTPSVREVLSTLVARGIAMAGPFAVSIITARVLGPEDRGHYFLIISYAQIASQIANLGLPSSNTYLLATRHELLGRLVVNSLYVAATLAPLTAVAVVIFLAAPELVGLAAPTAGSAGTASFAAVLLAPVMVAFLFLTNLAVAVGRVQLFNGLTILAGVAAVLAAVVAALLSAGTLGFLYAAVAALGLACILSYAFLMRGDRAPPTFDAVLFRRGIAYALRAYLATMFGFLMMRVGVIALQQRADFAEIGQFSIAQQIADALIILPSTVALLLFPSLLRTDGGQDRWKAMWRVLWSVAGLIVVVLIIFGFLADWLIPLVFGQAYAPAVDVVLWMFPAVIFLSIISMLSQYAAAQGFPWSQVGVWVVAFFIQAVLSYVLTGTSGALGVAYALGISTFFVMVCLVFITYSLRGRAGGESGQPA